MPITKEKKPVWYVERIKVLQAEVERLTEDNNEMLLQHVNKPIVPQMTSGYTDTRILLNGVQSEWRSLLATLPMPGVRLLIIKQGQLACKPGYLRLPLQEYDALDYWCASHFETNEGPVIRLTLSKDFQLVSQAKERHSAASAKLTVALGLYKGMKKAYDLEPEDSQSKSEYLRKMGEYQATMEQAGEDLEANPNGDFDETVWEIPFSECI